jgi:CheY-like chemotaxis protein
MRETPLGALDVLIADDDTPLRTDLRLVLEGHGFTCAEAADGREAVAVAREHLPRCLILDLSMPGLDGFAVARSLRADPRTSAIHIHCLTGLSDAVARQRAAEAGCEVFLTKPVGISELLGAIRSGIQTPESEQIAVATLAEAQEMLDWLENQGCTHLEFRIQSPAFVVSFVAPPGFHLRPNEDGEPRLVCPTV